MNAPEQSGDIQSSRLVAAAVVGPFVLSSIALWASHYLFASNANLFILLVMGLSVVLGGIRLSQALKRWPRFDYLLMVYLLVVPIALTVCGFLITVYVYGDGP